MAGIRHFTASAIVLDDHDRVLLVHHNKLRQWLYPGGHIDPNEDPAEAAIREVAEETGIHAEVISDQPFEHPAVRVVPPPFAILEMDVTDTKIGPHRHIDMVYLCHAPNSQLAPQLAEVADCRWTPIADIAGLPTPAELPSLIIQAATSAKSGR